MKLDAHIDVPWQQFKRDGYNLSIPQPDVMVDLPRMKAGGLDAAVFALYLSDAKQDELGDYNSTEAILRQREWLYMQSDIEVVSSSGAALRAHAAGKVPIFLALEGGRLLHDNVNQLAVYRTLGVSILILTHNKTTRWCDSATDAPRHDGLSSLGLDIVKRAVERYGMLIDVSHASDDAITKIINETDYRFIASHSGARRMLNHPRNLNNTDITVIASRGGVIGVPFARRFVGSFHGAIDHITHICQITGSTRYVGIGSDLDGAAMVEGFDSAASWSKLEEALSARGYTDEDIARILGDNFLRILA